MKVLFLSRWLPWPQDNGSKIRIYNLLRSLAQQHEVSLVSFVEPHAEGSGDALGSLRECLVSFRGVPYRDFRHSSMRSIAGFASTQPRWLVDTFNPRMRDTVATAAGLGCDVLVASQLDMVPYAIQLGGVPAILEELEVGQFERTGGTGVVTACRSWLTWRKLSAYIRRVLPRFDACTVASSTEQAKLHTVAPSYDRVYVIPNSIDLTRYGSNHLQPERHTLVYSGSPTFDANRDAIQYFVNDILPIVVRSEPDARLCITGRLDPGTPLAGSESPNVRYAGYVTDVRPTVGQSWACIVPLRRGGGTRLKILEAMALGTPVVSTSRGAEGLEVVDGEHILLADDARTFADKVVQLLRSPELRTRLSVNGRRLVASRYDARSAGAALCSLVERVTRCA